MITQRKILFIDDDILQRELFTMYLIDEGYEVHQANNGKEGIDKLNVSNYDLVILDIRMPDFDGIEMINAMITEREKTPIIIHTAYLNYKKNYETWTADAYITKSSNPEKLLWTVNDILRK